VGRQVIFDIKSLKISVFQFFHVVYLSCGKTIPPGLCFECGNGRKPMGKRSCALISAGVISDKSSQLVFPLYKKNYLNSVFMAAINTLIKKVI